MSLNNNCEDNMNNNNNQFKIYKETEFCTKNREYKNQFPMNLEENIYYNSCTGLKVSFLGQEFFIEKKTNEKFVFEFKKGTKYSMKNDEIGMIKVLENNQQMCVGNATKIFLPKGTILKHIENDISIIVNIATDAVICNKN